ncbi:hypothetical protein [uncultured Prevotella sp.]|uniref:hypothetical protein n=1 Tax=uncultured Prevotella sp. TaxID=159272 RepID=UPI0025D002F2|nr:hypothetical protein [uncultured Prevotella sp.]
MTKYLDKVGLTEYTKLMKAHVAKSTLKIGESSGTAYDGAKGKANADFISGVKNGNLALVSPEIRGRWSVFNAAGTVVESMGSSSTSLSLENGYQASWTGSFLYPAAKEGQKVPTSVSGNWTALPAANTPSATYKTPEKVKTDTTISATIAAAKTGLMVSGTDVKPASGNDTKTASASVHFYHRRYFGLASTSSITADVIKGLSKTDLNNSRTAKLTGISATDAQYYVIAYPKAMGELTKIVQNGATPLLNGGFVKSEVTVTNAAGASIVYLVYRTVNPGALKDNSFLEIA